MKSTGGIVGEFTLKDGKKLYTKEWKAVRPDAPEASVVFLHGYSDHCNAYYDLFQTLASMGIEVFSFDQRGWGRSALPKKQWGACGGTSAILSDLDEIIIFRLSHLKTLFTSPPLFLLGHSAGGSLCLTYAYRGTHRKALGGYLAWAPFITIAPEHRPCWLKVFLGRAAGRIFPNHHLYHGLDVKMMSRNPSVCKDLKDDELCHELGTLLGLSEMLDRGMSLVKKDVVRKFDAEKPVMVMQGTKDMLIDKAGSEEFVRLLDVKDKEYKEYVGGFHKLHADTPEMAPVFANDVGSWVLSRTRGTITKPPSPSL